MRLEPFGERSGDLVVPFPYREGEIEKVSYTRDDNFLNIVVRRRKRSSILLKRMLNSHVVQSAGMLFIVGRCQFGLR